MNESASGVYDLEQPRITRFCLRCFSAFSSLAGVSCSQHWLPSFPRNQNLLSHGPSSHDASWLSRSWFLQLTALVYPVCCSHNVISSFIQRISKHSTHRDAACEVFVKIAAGFLVFVFACLFGAFLGGASSEPSEISSTDSSLYSLSLPLSSMFSASCTGGVVRGFRLALRLFLGGKTAASWSLSDSETIIAGVDDVFRALALERFDLTGCGAVTSSSSLSSPLSLLSFSKD